MPHQTYRIPVIAADMRREETIHHICDALEQLEQVSSEIFSRICKRVEQNQAALKNINKRVDLAQAKISTLKGSHKATKVFSSAKYPNSSDSSHLYSSLHNGTNNVPHSYKERKIAARHKTVDEKTLKEKLQFFNVNIKTKREKSDLLQADYESEGLGRLPSHIDSVSSLLLFNTSENPYKKYVLLDPLGVVTKTRTTDADDSTALAEAPPTISEGEELHRQVNPGMFYTPAPGDVPEIAVPDFLPDLLGVADDLSYSADLGPSIAPSAPLTVPDLPELDMGGDDSALPQGPAGGGTAVVDSSISASALPPPPPAAPPPPPPPPPSTAPPPPPPSTVAPPPPPPSTVAPPPPPPGPPPPTLPAQVNQGDDIDTSKQPAPQTKKVVPDMDGGRSSLLDSIRKAGGVGKMKLRSAKERRLEDKKKKKEKSEMAATSGGDLMGDLSRALNLRRRGISGANKNSSDKGGDKPSAMDRISAMIPAPPPNAEPAEQSDEWD